MRDTRDGKEEGALFCKYIDEYCRSLGYDDRYTSNMAIAFDASRSARTASETRPASISSYLCIKY
jgi:hypothetical protein